MPKTDTAMALVEDRLGEAAASPVPLVRAAVAHLIGAGGGRVRPRFALIVARLLGTPEASAVAMAAAAELVHAATLMHDDVLDHAARRRGRASVQARFGAGTAVLAGDFLLTRALEGLTALGLFAATHEMSLAVRAIVEGELAQLEAAFDPETSLEQSKRIAAGKTGALFAWCARAQAVTLGLAPAQTAAADRLGAVVGYAFQVADDRLDLGTADVGKPVRNDLREGQLGVPVQLARAADEAVDAAVRAAFASRDPADFDRAYRALDASRAAELARGELARCREEAAALAALLARDPADATALLAFYDASVAAR